MFTFPVIFISPVWDHGKKFLQASFSFHMLRWSMASIDLEMNWNAFKSSVIYKVCFSDAYSLYLDLLAVNEINSALEIMLVASRDERGFKR